MAGLGSLWAFAVAFSVFRLGSYLYPLVCPGASIYNYCNTVLNWLDKVHPLGD